MLSSNSNWNKKQNVYFYLLLFSNMKYVLLDQVHFVFM